ncbi:hypothetical protein JXA40_02380 [bacterium]|nr:hypothetical protein [candidate division CSSED10-310 bacterium]
MRPEIKKLLYDIHRAAENIVAFTEGGTLDDYLDNALLRSGVEHQFEIIGEALNQAVRMDSSLTPALSTAEVLAMTGVRGHRAERIKIG